MLFVQDVAGLLQRLVLTVRSKPLLVMASVTLAAKRSWYAAIISSVGYFNFLKTTNVLLAANR
jgi:hypothetical protein